jgi:hypothetical protein
MGASGDPGWQRRRAAHPWPWLDGIRQRHGMDPQIKFFHTACIIDNATGKILLPEAAG